MTRKGPFGLWMGMSVADVAGEVEEVASCKYSTFSVPKPHSAFERYILEIAPIAGLGWIKAIGHTIETNSFGTHIIGAFEAMVGKLTATYGECQQTDLLLFGSIWDEPRDWMQGLESRDRILMAEWSPEHGSILPNSLISVALIASAIDSSSGYISIEYSFENFDAVEAEIAALEDDAL